MPSTYTLEKKDAMAGYRRGAAVEEGAEAVCT